MKKIASLFLSAFLVCVPFSQALEVIINTGSLKVPNRDGTFRNTSVGNAATVFLCLTDANTYDMYASDSRSLYDAWKAGEFSSEEYHRSGNTSSGIFEVTFDEVDDDPLNTYYTISIAQYESVEFGRTYYIARALKTVNTNDDELMPLNISPTLDPVGSWSFISEPVTEVRWPIGAINISSSSNNVSLSWDLPTEGMTLAGDDLIFRLEGSTSVNGPWTQCGSDVAVSRNASQGSATIETAGTPFATAGCGFFRLWWTNKAGQ